MHYPFMRNQSLFDGEANAELLEQWAVRIVDFGDRSSRGTLDFKLHPDIGNKSQPLELSKAKSPMSQRHCYRY